MTVTEPLGLKRGEVVVAPYDPRWPGLFEEASADLVGASGPSLLAVHHVGSTSVPGLPAKPILDLLVSVADFDGAVQMVPTLGALGYEFCPEEEIPDRHYFRRPPGGDLRTHHLSLAEPTSWHHRAALAFRDALRGDSGLASAYAELKKNLAIRFPRDRPAYIEGKSQFIQDVLLAEGVHRGGAP